MDVVDSYLFDAIFITTQSVQYDDLDDLQGNRKQEMDVGCDAFTVGDRFCGLLLGGYHLASGWRIVDSYRSVPCVGVALSIVGPS